MINKSNNNLRENLINSSFKTTKTNLSAFSSVSLLLGSALVVLLLIASSFFFVEPVSSKQAQAVSLGTDQITNIFPSKVTSTDFKNKSGALTQDLPDYSLYQEFNQTNSAVLKEFFVEEEEVSTSEETDTVQSGSDEIPVELQTEEVLEQAPDASAEDVEQDEDVAPAEEVVSFGVQPSRGIFPLAQLTLTSSSEQLPVDVVEVEQSVEEIVVTSEEAGSNTTAEEPVTEGEGGNVDETAGEEMEPPSGPVREIEFSDFSVPRSNSVEFLDGLQLRISFAAKAKQPLSEKLPYVDVLFGNDEEGMRSVGAILIDEEVSNSINGGYYLFPLPAFISPDELKDSKVVLQYHGEVEAIESMYLDAVWLEMNTKIISKEELEKRGVAEQLTQLEAPKLSVLLSDQLNFDRGETPIFNLRYESQQNFLTRGLRQLFGRGGFGVKDIAVSHDSVGFVPVSPDVTVANDGLVTIEFPQDDLDVLPPGTYQISIVYEENGEEYTDTFDFEWGVLSINPDKTEYEVGETAQISMGALSPNGNTLCDALLGLYITDPTGFITRVPVAPSGECNGNNVIDVPDYTAELPILSEGIYEMYLERVDEFGAVIGFTKDTFTAVADQKFSITREGPTRIYPRVAYPMKLTVYSEDGFSGVVHERVPASFVISSTSADISQDGDWQVLSWDVSIPAGGSQAVEYGFDAPDISPYLYNLGVASLEGDVSVVREITREVVIDTTNASSTEVTSATSTVTEQVTSTENGIAFEEHRQWQIASDATGSMLLMWAGSTIPTGWTCVSCTGGDPFYQRFIVGSSTAGNIGGATTHTHTFSSAVVNTTAAAGVSATGGGGADAATRLHTHTVSPTIGAASNLPAYRQLVLIQNNSAGEPSSIPTGAITIFDATVPAGWTQYNAQNGNYVRGESVANRTLTGGANTHTHSVTGTLSGPTGTTNAPGFAGVSVATNVHTHTINTITPAESNEPPYIEVILGQLNATSSMPDDAIAMWTDSEPSGWNNVSTSSQPFNNRFFKPAATYGTTGGASSHTPANATGLVTGGPSGAVNRSTNAANADASGAHTHTVDISGFSNATHLPPYRTAIFAKRAGGAPPEAPTLYTLFDDESTGTSSPEFEFTAEDSVGTDDLEYQFQWDDDSDLNDTPIGDRTSDDETGCSPDCFENVDTPSNTSPFNETERIRFTIQDTLTANETYYWRVRARKSGGSWGAWSAVQAFTYTSDTDPSQWYQTDDAQFDKNVFTNTETFGSDKVRIVQSTPVEALVAYGEGTVQTPRYRIWDGSAWSAEASAQNVGGTIQWVRTAAGTTRDEYVLGTHDANNDVNVQVYDGGAGTWGDLVEVTAAANDTTRRAFDVAYETLSGDALIVYCNGTDAAYRVWNGSSWSSQTTITTASANACNYISLASNPVSDEVVVVTRDNSAGATDYEALVWNGTTWGNSITLGTMSDTNHEGIAVEYEESGGQAVVAVSNGGTSGFVWTSWNGIEWSTATAYALGDDFEWGVLKRDVGSDKMSLCYIDNDADIGWVEWGGDGWGTFTERDTGGNIFDGRAVSCEYEITSGRDGYVMFPYSDTTNARYQYWDSLAWTTESSISTIGDSWEVGTVRAGDGKILAYFHDDGGTQYDFSYWNGTSWSTAETLETTTSVTAAPFRQPIGMSAKIYQPSEGYVTSYPVAFNQVPNRPTWGEVVWNATEQNGTDVKLQVLYATTTYCNVLVPDGALPGNSTGFDAGASPLDLTGLSTTTYSSLCLRATLSTSNQNVPTLNDWTISWERQPYLVQSAFGWYANRNNETPNDAWPSGATDLAENEAIPVEYSPGSGNVLRLRMAVRTDNAALEADEKAFKLQYTQTGGVCASSTTWYDVGAVGSTTAEWRGYNNLLAFDGSTISTLLLTGSDVGGTYEEENDSDINPNTATLGQETEWDWVLQHNGADDGQQYCFRMVNDDGAVLNDYENYPSLITNTSPDAPSLEKLFDNEQVASTTPWFEFTASDIENDDVTYQIQVDNDYDFSSVAIDKNSLTHLSQFENIVTPADKDPFTSGQSVRFKSNTTLTNGVTYYWRVRGKDVNGSNDWGEWSTIYSFTVNTGTTITTWYQTEREQFDSDDYYNTESTAFDDTILSSGFTEGTTTSTVIDYDSKTTGNAWGELSWNDNEVSGSITYHVEYLNSGNWELVPDSFLPNNSTGFSTSPVSLLGLDPQIHNEIRIRADMFDSGGSPRLLDWKVEWGYAVEQPTQIALFDNEKTGTTTPTFIFTTTDPENDDIQYQLSWSTDNTFTSSTTVTSGLSAGFSNVTTGADTSPFFSGDTINYKMQSALTNGTTYWWKVRGRDPSGGNSWSVWSPSRSFTVDTSVTVSTWHQTTDEQFETDSLNGIESTGSDSVEVTSIIREAMTAYAEGAIQTPRYRIWNGSTWSAENSAQSVGGTIRFVEVAASQARDEYIIGTQEATGRVRAQVYDGVSETFGDLQTIVAAVPGLTSRGYDIAYESSSGDALVVACNGTEATYSVWNGSSWSGATAITLGVTANCNWIELASDPTSDEIILVVRDSITGATDYQALVWNGSSWGNSMTMGSMAEAANQGAAVEYEESGDRAVVVVSNGANASFSWNSWNGTAWSGVATQADQDDFENGRLSRDLGSDNMALCSIDQDGQIKLFRWTGSSNSWSAYTTVDTVGNSKTGRPADCVFETTSGRDGYIMIPYSDTTNARSQFWNGTVLSGEATLSTITDSQEVQAVRTGDGNILAVFYDDANTQYDFSYWNGTAWATAETLETTSITTTVPATIPISLAARKYPTFTSGTVYSTPIDFDDGSGLKWQQATFNDTTPGSSQITYQVEYLNGDTWELIPDTALTGNSSGFTSSPIDLSQVSRITYNTIRLVAELECISGDCPTLNDWSVEWSSGINVSGTLKQFDRTASTTSGTVAIAVNGVIQTGKTAVVSNGAWTIPNVTAFPGDVVTTFVQGAADSAEAVGVTLYDGDGDITGINLFELHLSIGSNDATTTAITNTDIGAYDFTNTEDIFFDVSGTAISMCATTGCSDGSLYVRSGAIYQPGGNITTHDVRNYGTVIGDTYTFRVSGSWENNNIFTPNTSTVIFTATSVGSAPAPWYNASWSRRIPVTIPSGAVGSTLTDFPVYVDLSDLGSGFFSNVRADGGDIRVTTADGQTELPREVVAIDTGGSTGEIHFEADTIAASSDTTFYVYFGNATATDYATNATYGAENVWANGYEMVYHMDEDPSAGAPQYVDSTGNSNATAVNMEGGDRISTPAGNGAQVDGVDESVQTSYNNTALTSTWTLFLNANGTQGACDGVMFSRGTGVNGMDIGACGDTSRIGYHWENLAATAWNWTGGPTYPTGQWFLASMVIQPSQANFYAISSGGVNTGSNAFTHNTSTLDNLDLGWDPFGVARSFNGSISEARLSSVARSQDWLSATYDNLSDSSSFYSGGTIEVYGSLSDGSETISESDGTINFYNVTFGETSGTAVWKPLDTLDVEAALVVAYGTLNRTTEQILVAGNVTNQANGFWTGVGTTTFDGNVAATWRDQNSSLQNFGNVVVDGTSKLVTLAGNVAAESITIGANDTLDASTSNYDITVYGNWNNQNNFIARSGEVFFAAGSTGKTITTTGDAFYDLTFNGSGGGWSFTEATALISNDVKFTAGTVTMPTGTTTIAGSFVASTGTFQHNNGTLYFTSGGTETITFAGGAFTNVAYNMTFQGTGNWTVTDTNATSTNNVRVAQGTLNFPSGVFAIGGSLADVGGVYNGGTGTIRFYSATAKVLTAGGSSYNNVIFDGAGSWSFSDTNVTVSNDITVTQGTLTLPSGTFSIAGSYDNNATVNPGTGTVLFNSTDSGETIAFGASSLYNVWFNHSGGGWTITEHATTTHNLSITAANNLTVSSGQMLAVGGTFTNSVGGAATTWTGSTLSLYAGAYSLNTKSNTGDQYGTLKIGANTDIKMWNSSSTAYAVDSSGSLYSQDHSNVNGDLYIWGSYERTSGTEYWSYDTDFDGAALTGINQRQVNVRFASEEQIEVFTTDGTFTPPAGVDNVEVLVVAGGGGGGSATGFANAGAGGGGAGGLVYETNFAVTPLTPITVDIGNGGAGGPSGNNSGSTGQNTTFGTITALGGGGGIGGNGNGANGGSGGGARGGTGGSATQPGSGSGGFGNKGGDGGGGAPAGAAAGGGGGAGTAGQNRAGTAGEGGGNGGDGLAYDISGATTYYAGGGGGGAAQANTPVGTGGLGGGGTGGNNGTAPTAGAANTGGGGGGGNNAQTGAAGGSGIVIVRYTTGSASASITGGTLEIEGISTASTTIANQGTGSYSVLVNNGTLRASYYEFEDLGGDGLSLVGATVPTMDNGSFAVGQAGASAITLSSTTINASPSKQINNVRFATTTAITAYNVSQTDGTPSSFWWFKGGLGNLYGEAFDNDTGNPGSVRFDDSSLVITVSGTVYSDGGTTPLAGGTCDGSTQVVRVVVNGGTSYTGSCSNVDGSYSVPGVTFSGDPTLTIFLDNASGGEKGSVVTRTPTGDVTDMDIYANRVIVRNEDIDAVTNANLAVYDVDNDADLRFTATGNNLTVLSGNELHVFATSTYTPGGTITLQANASANGYDGTLYVANGATLNAYASSTLTVGGRMVLESGATFNPASTTVLMTATTSGKSITAPGTISFNNLTFNGTGGAWNLGANLAVAGNMTVTAGTVTGTGNITLTNGSLTGNGVLSLGAGTTTINRSNTLGGTSPWTFYNLQLGNGTNVGTTTPVFTATTTIAGKLTIAAAHFLDAGATTWDLSGTGTVFVENGTFLEDTSTVRYSGAGSNVRATTYYNLDINAGSGSQTYTALGTGVAVTNNLTVGGQSNSVFDVNANDPVLDVNGSLTIRSNGTFGASASALFTVAGNYTNDGTFNGNLGTVTFDGAGATSIAAGNSSFSNVRINKTGSVNITEHATTSAQFTLQAASSFTVSSGQALAVGGTFYNALGGAATTWTGSVLRLSGNGNYSINAATTTDSYGTLDIDGTTQIRMWNSDASTYDVNSTASLYSQDHANNAGDLYIWGSYRRTSGADYWAYATDFDGTALGGGSRKVDVFMASGATVFVTGGSLSVQGISTASTTLQNQGSGTYGITIGGNASTSWQYYEVTDTNSSGLVFTGAPSINTLSYGSFEVSQNGGSGMTVGGTVISANPAKNFTRNQFFLNGVGSGFNVTATGTSVSAWRFANHYGDIDGEAFDVDPNGDPGYIGWDDSAALITISGNVYSDEAGTVSGVCDGVTNNITLRVAGITTYTTSCNATTGAYSVSNVSYGSADSIIVYIDGETEKGAVVTQDPISNINGLSIYENRVVVRHESTDPITIDDMAVWDSSDDVDIPFTAVSGSPDTLTLPANRKLIVASTKTFAPGGNVTVSGGGAGASYDGTVELYSNANWVGAGTEALSVGGSFILNTGADLTTSNGTTTFTTTGAGRTIDLNENALHNVVFSGSGSWTMTDTTFTANGDVTKSAGTLTFPTGTSTFNGSFVQSGGTFTASGGLARFTGAGEVLRMGGSNLATVVFVGGNYTMTDTNATSTGSTTIQSGTITLPSGIFSVGGDFKNTGGAITHNTSELVLRNAIGATLLASSSDLFAVRFAGGGDYTMEDDGITFLDDLLITGGSAVQLASGTVAVGGSFDAVGGTFTNATTTFLFNSADTGETINPGASEFYAVQVSAPTGGYTLTGNATTTHNFTLASAQSFAVQGSAVLRVEGVFTNTVGGTNTNWNSSTLVLDGANGYTINTKTTGADRYNILTIGANSDVRMWNSSATTTNVTASASLYSQDHGATNGLLNIYGDFHIGTTTEYWSYARDFDGTLLSGGQERGVFVAHAANATTTVDGGSLQIVGTSGNKTTITNQGSGTYSFNVSAGTLNAQYYSLRNMSADGLNLSGSPTISSLSNGDYELAVSGGTLITVASSTINANASKVISGNSFATTTAITGNNVTVVDSTSNAWTFTGHTGNLDGEAYDDDGVTACGSIRWTDSSCLITQQTHYRWRNDDGNGGVPNSEWFNTNWDARKSVRVDNADSSTYSDAVVQMFVQYDSNMQADFDDLRFTDSDGVTPLSFWIGSTTDSAVAEVWVKVPSLPAEDTAVVYMYYNNPTANSSSSADGTFIAADDFEDGNMTEYSGQTTLFNVGSTNVFDGAYSLDNSGDESSRANTGGIYRLDQTVSQGETFRFMQYVDTVDGSGDEVCTKFGVQSPGSANNNYAVCIEQFGVDRISLVKNVIDNEGSGTILASSTVTYATGWYEVEVDWETDNDIIVSLYEADGSLVTSFSDTDSSYTSGGIGFTYWYHYGAWDSVSSRPILTTEPTVRFGAEQADGGASWKAAQDTQASYDVDDIARLRITLENSGLAITNQQLLLEYANMGSAPSCEAVDTNDFVAVPIQSSCGTSPVCMQSTTYFTNGDVTGDLLNGAEGEFAPGELREDPTNVTGNLNIDENHYTEVEYAITPTENITDENICFRVTDNGDEYDTYLRVAHMSLQFDPIITTISLNSGLDISLLPGTTTRVYATGTVTDLNGAGDLALATTTFYRSGATGGASCSQNDNDCYISTSANKCSFTDCAGTSCTLSCYADIFFYADPTSPGSLYEGEVWYAFAEVEDSSQGYDFDTSIGQELNLLRAISVENAINYGSLAVGQDTGSTNASTTVENQGNAEIDLEVEGTDMTDGYSSVIPVSEQKFSTSTFTYSSCLVTVCNILSISPVALDVDLAKTTALPATTDDIYWGVEVPVGANSAPHTGMNVFTPVSP